MKKGHIIPLEKRKNMGPKKGTHNSPKTEIQKGQRLSKKTEFQKGHNPWNKKGNPTQKLLRRRILEKHNPNFGKEFKRAIRKRDNQICMLCGVHREKLNKSLDIHHVNYNKFLSIPQNCISLCHSCHPKTNHNRKHWMKFFQNLLSERYGYIYEDNKVVLRIGKDCGAA